MGVSDPLVLQCIGSLCLCCSVWLPLSVLRSVIFLCLCLNMGWSGTGNSCANASQNETRVAEGRTKVQVLPGKFGGSFDETLDLTMGQEHQRKEALVEATLKRMKELAKEEGSRYQMTTTSIKIKETMTFSS